jgi:hypothetical protein
MNSDSTTAEATAADADMNAKRLTRETMEVSPFSVSHLVAAKAETVKRTRMTNAPKTIELTASRENDLSEEARSAITTTTLDTVHTIEMIVA